MGPKKHGREDLEGRQGWGHDSYGSFSIELGPQNETNNKKCWFQTHDSKGSQRTMPRGPAGGGGGIVYVAVFHCDWGHQNQKMVK